MKRVRFAIVAVSLFAGRLAPAAAPTTAITVPDFPLPKFARDEYGRTEEVSVIRLLRELQTGGVHAANNFQAADSDYTIVSSESLGLLSAWLEAACKSAGIQLPLARLRAYDGAVYANLLEVATNIAASRKLQSPLAIPVGVMICHRTKPWGALPGDGERDAYVLIATERGFVVFDPPTRQLAMLADYPNNSAVIRIRL